MNPPKTTPRRTFTSSFALGDTVAIKRTRHGWFNGTIGGPIVEITDHTCVVEVGEWPDISQVEIEHPRDIVLCQAASPNPKPRS